MKFAVYSRKSVDTGRGESIENQIEMCKNYIFSKYSEATEGDIAVFEDEGFSAKSTARPEFQRMLRLLREKRFSSLVCYRLDRLSRSVGDFSALIEELNTLDVALICIREEFDTSKPMGKAMMYIASVFAQLERETIAERVRDNMLMLARSGRWLGGTPPFGFQSGRRCEVILEGGVKSVCSLRENPEEIGAVREIFRKFSELRSVSALGRHLAARGILSRSGRPFSPPGLKEILQNPAYCAADSDALAYFKSRDADLCFQESDLPSSFGLLAYNKRDYRKKSARRRAPSDWIVAIGRHPGTIPGRLWAGVQAILEENRPKRGRAGRTRNDRALLSGMICCAGCGEKMFAKSRSGNRERFDYICKSKLRGGLSLCTMKNLPGAPLDRQVELRLLPFLPPLWGMKKELSALAKALQREAGNSRFLRDDPNAPADTETEEITRLAASLSDWSGALPLFSLSERRTLFRLLLEKIIWDGETLRLFPRRSATADGGRAEKIPPPVEADSRPL